MQKGFKILEDVLALALLAAMIGTILWLGSMAYGMAFGPEITVVASARIHPRPETHQVLPGETLWQIAAEHYPGMHTGEVVHEIRKANDLGSATIYPHQVLVLPEVDSNE